MADNPPSYTQATSSTDEEPRKHDSNPSSSANEDVASNVLFVGETQNGKSTLIRQLNVYAGRNDLEIGVGRGTDSCTTRVGLYPLTTTLRQYYLVDDSGREIRKKSFSDLVDLTDEDASVKSREPEDHGKRFNFNFIDTPGLDDSQGRDMDIMMDIVGRISELDHLNAIVYVRRADRPFGHSFNKFYHYLQRCIPAVANGLIVAHTDVSVGLLEEYLSRHKDWRTSREEAFQKAVKSSTLFQHVFMDNEPDESSPFAVQQSLDACFKLLSMVKTTVHLPTDGMTILKSPQIIQRDQTYLLALERLRNSLNKTWHAELDGKNKMQQEALRQTREIDRLDIEIQEQKTELSKLDNDSPIVLGNRAVDRDYGFIKDLLMGGVIGFGNEEVTFEADCKITQVEKSATGGSKWGNETLGSKGLTWKAILETSVFRSAHGSATFYGTLRDKHTKEVVVLKKSLANLERSKDFLTDSLNSNAESGKEKISGAEKLGKHVVKCEEIIGKVKKDTMDPKLWPVLKRFYSAHETPSYSETREFIQVYDEEIADLM